jgi:hypothetical protein
MNRYIAMIDLKQEAKALAFASAVEAWMSHLQNAGTIHSWQLMRQKLNLASDRFRDFIIEIEIDDLAQLDKAFRLTGSHDEDIASLHRAVHDLIANIDFALYRDYPDPERAERMALL